jgi:hypothetical protein
MFNLDLTAPNLLDVTSLIEWKNEIKIILTTINPEQSWTISMHFRLYS